MLETIDQKQKEKWIDLLNKHKPTEQYIVPNVYAKLLANQEKVERGEIEKRTLKDILLSLFGKPAKMKK